jgi:hypothetical protein
VFYFFQAVTSSHTITVSPTGTLDAIIVVYSGNCFNLNQIACIDQPGGNGVVTSLTVNNLNPTQMYTIRVYDYGAANTTNGNFSICVTHQCTIPPAPTNISGDGPDLCQSNTATVFMGADGQNPAALPGGGQWVWYSGSCGGQQVGTGPDIDVSASQPGSTTYFVRAENGCGVSSCVSYTVNITAKPSTPVPTVNPAQPCLGSVFTLNTNASGTSYDWDGPSGVTITNQQSPAVSNGVSGQYCVSYKQNGCWSDEGCVSINFSQPPSSPTFNPVSGCGSVLVTANSSGCGGCNYQWSNGGGNPNTISSSNSYTVTVTNSNNCTVSASVNITVNPAPSISINTSSQTVTPGQTVTLTAQGASSYQWNNGSTGAQINVTPFGTTSYSVTGTDANGCTATGSVTILISSVEDLAKSEPHVSPNPSNGTFTVSFETEKPETIQLKVFDLLGQLIKQESPVTVSGTYAQQLNLTQMPKGIYLLQIKAGEESTSRRIEIQ